MNPGVRETIINITISLVFLSGASLLVAGKSDVKFSEILSFNFDNMPDEPLEIAQADLEANPTPLPTMPPPPVGPCPCTPPATPSPTPHDPDVPPVASTPTPDTSSSPPPFTVTINNFY